MGKNKAAPAQGTLGLPDLEVAKPRRGKNAALGYHWRLGASLPELGTHSVAKHDIYDTYVARFIRTLTKRHVQTQFRLTIVDGFCGGGLYAFAGDVVAGSPLRLLKAIDGARAEILKDRPNFLLDVDFVFVDENREHIAFLQNELIARGYGSQIGGKIRLIQSTFEDAAPSVIAEIRKKGRAHHSLFFLDQYGWSDVKLATVRTIMGQLANPEVILTFMVDSLINLMSDKRSSINALAAIDFTREDVRDLVAMKDDLGWKRLIQNTLYAHIQRQTGAAFYTPSTLR